LLREKSKLGGLEIPDPRGGGRMHNGIQALELYRQRLGQEKMVEGWVEGPVAQAADLRGINTLMTDFYDDPLFVRELFEFVTELELRFAGEQAKAGADVIGIGDAAASLLGPALYEEFAWPFEKRLVDGIRALGVRTRLHICGDIRRNLRAIGRLGCDILDLDSLVPIRWARDQVGAEQVILGNLNPVKVMRDGSAAEVMSELEACHRAAGERYILGAGCEIPRGTPLENLRVFSEYAKTRRV
jgi:MtaA/CmuA family methyltransferase